MQLRLNVWARKYKAAIAFLEKLGTPIAQKTLEIIKSKKVQIKSYSQVTHSDFWELHDEYYAERKKEKHAYPPSKRFIQSIGAAWSGAIYGNRIYIDPNLDSVRKVAKVIVHEVNHFIHDSNNHLDTDKERFIEELRANLSEKVAFKPTLRFTPSFLREKAKKIIHLYELNLDETVLTEEVKAKVLKGLR